MSFHDPSRRLPEPDWMIGDDAARGINQPPEDKYLPDDERLVVAELREATSDMIDEIKGYVKQISMLSIALDEQLPVAYKALSDLSALADEFHSDTVGDDWDEITGEREDFEDR